MLRAALGKTEAVLLSRGGAAMTSSSTRECHHDKQMEVAADKGPKHELYEQMKGGVGPHKVMRYEFVGKKYVRLMMGEPDEIFEQKFLGYINRTDLDGWDVRKGSISNHIVLFRISFFSKWRSKCSLKMVK